MNEQATAFRRGRLLGAFMLLFVLGFLLYTHTWNAPFVFDDDPNILENASIRMTKLTAKQILRIAGSPSPRPLANFTFAGNYYFHRYQVAGYRLVNILIHIATAFLVFLVAENTLRLSRINIPRSAALLTALFWLTHPLHTQSVTYIVQRMNSLAALFCMLALFCYISARQQSRYRSNRRRWRSCLLFITCGVSWLLGLGSKETAATLPLILFFYEWYFFQNLEISWAGKKRIGIILVILFFFAIIFFRLGSNPFDAVQKTYENKDFSFSQRLLTEPRVVVYYLSLIVFPHPDRLNLDYRFPLSQGLFQPATTFLSLILVLMLLITAIASARTHRLTSFGILWFLTTLAIESSVIGLALIFEHRTYLPSIFPVLLFNAFLLRHIRPRFLALGILLTIIIVNGYWTCSRNTVWNTEIALWQDCMAKSPRKARPYNNLGAFYTETGSPEKSLPYLRSAIRLDPTYEIAYTSMGTALLQLGRYPEALSYFRQALATGHATPNLYVNMGAAFQRSGEMEKAIRCYEQALEIKPFRKAYNNLGKAYYEKGELETSRQYLRKAVQISPTYTVAWKNLETLQNIIAKHQKAMADIKKQLQSQPFNSDLLYQLSSLHVALGQYDQAARTYETLAAILPGNATIFYNLACLYARQKQTEQAITNLKKAIHSGYADWRHIKTDNDLENIRHTGYFQNLMKTLPDSE